MATPSEKKTAAFFDVDGTIVSTTIVHYYARLRSLLLPSALRPVWLAWFALKVVYYFFLDKVSRTRFNRVFYRNYRGLEAESVKRLAHEEFSTYVRSKIFPDALNHIREHQSRGDLIVLVTGSLDFIIKPLADYINAEHALTVQLNEAAGKFTGELTTPPLGEAEKARVIKAFSEQHDIDLASSYAYGDSRADVPMLRCVGNPVVVNPGKALRQIAVAAGWTVREWMLKT
ncbi:MAG: HAD-IB family hydrolase [Candidatus Poribacteria bacterium]|nr:HAD-IB family hydrolase [Candidatus Poribacteria bacterium]